MEFSLDKSLQLLERTPSVLSTWLPDLDEDFILNNEGENTWNVKEVLAHLIVCEKTNWIVRAKIILAQNPDLNFTPIDMNAHFELAKTVSLSDLLNNFTELRTESIEELKDFNLNDADFSKTANHPVLGTVNLQQLLSTWVSHDLSHISQIARIMAMQNKENIGPFITFLKFLNKN